MTAENQESSKNYRHAFSKFPSPTSLCCNTKLFAKWYCIFFLSVCTLYYYNILNEYKKDIPDIIFHHIWFNCINNIHIYIYIHTHKQPYSVGLDNDKLGLLKQLDMQSTASFFPANTDYSDTCHQPTPLGSFHQAVWIHPTTVGAQNTERQTCQFNGVNDTSNAIWPRSKISNIHHLLFRVLS